MRRRLHALVLVLSISAGSARADVRVVDSSGAGDFLDVQAANDAFSDGDVILLRRPPVVTVERFGLARIDGKSLTLVGVELAHAPLRSIIVEKFPNGAVVVLPHLDVGLELGDRPLDLRASNSSDANAGSVRIEDCRAVGRGHHKCHPTPVHPAVQ